MCLDVVQCMFTVEDVWEHARMFHVGVGIEKDP